VERSRGQIRKGFKCHAKHTDFSPEWRGKSEGGIKHVSEVPWIAQLAGYAYYSVRKGIKKKN
jgi:hypothetical protein